MNEPMTDKLNQLKADLESFEVKKLEVERTVEYSKKELKALEKQIKAQKELIEDLGKLKP